MRSMRTWGARARVGAVRAAVVTTVATAALVIGVTPAFAARGDRAEGPDGSGAAVINTAAGGIYKVSVDAVNSHADVAVSSVQLDVVDHGGARQFREFYMGGSIRDTIQFANRGPCTVQITFRFARVAGESQSNLAHPFMLTYP